MSVRLDELVESRDIDVINRFWANVDRGDPEDCHLWQAGHSDTGYGNFDLYGETELAHRIAYVLAIGPIPGNLEVLHECDVFDCCNPQHLRLGTPSERMKKMYERNPNARSCRFKSSVPYDALKLAAEKVMNGMLLRDAGFELGISAVHLRHRLKQFGLMGDARKRGCSRPKQAQGVLR